MKFITIFIFVLIVGTVQQETKEETLNDGPATIVTTDSEDSTLKKHYDSFPVEDNEINKDEIEE